MPFDSNICEATGNPPPRVQLLQPVENNNNVYKCLAENTHIDNSGKKTDHYEIVDFYCKYLVLVVYNHFTTICSVGNTTGACGPTERPTRYIIHNIIIT